MSIRQNVFRIGETVEISGSFLPTTASGGLITVKNPNGDIMEYPVEPVDGVVSISIPGDVVGTWKVRLECTEPSVAVIESKFEVVASTVLPMQVISTTINPTLFTAGVTAV